MILLKLFYYKKNCKIANSARIYPFSKVTNSIISDFTYISYNCIINNCSIGKFCSIANGVKIGLGKHPTNFISTSPFFYSKNNALKDGLTDKLKFKEYEKVTIGNDVWIGANAIIMDGVKIGDGAIVGANSVVTKNVEPYSIIGGIPAKLIRNRFPEKIVNELKEIKWWDNSMEIFKSEKIKDLFSREFTEENLQLLKLEIKNIIDKGIV